MTRHSRGTIQPKWIILSFCLLFIVSTLFPIVASTININLNRLVGVVDVFIALALAVFAIIIRLRRREPRNKGTRRLTLSIYKVLFSIPLVLMVLFLAGLKIRWEILLVGLAWRFWLLSLVIEDLVEFVNQSSRDYYNDRPLE